MARAILHATAAPADVPFGSWITPRFGYRGTNETQRDLAGAVPAKCRRGRARAGSERYGPYDRFNSDDPFRILNSMIHVE